MKKHSRREFAALASAVGLLSGVQAAVATAQERSDSGSDKARLPNIVLITTDHMRVDNIGANGASHMVTPVLDGLVKRGVSFTMCNTVGVACSPNRASLMSGRYPHSHGVMSNGIKMPEDEVTLTHVLRDRGYYTGQFGKLHFWPHSARNHREYHPPYGFHQMRLSDEPGNYDDAYGRWLNAQGTDVRRKANVRMPPAARDYGSRRPEIHTPPEPRHGLQMYVFEGEDDTTHAHWVASETVGFIEESTRTRPDQPFFTHTGFYAPHPPLNPPASQLDRYEGRKFPPRKTDPEEIDLVPEAIAARMRQGAAISEEDWNEYRRYFYAMVSNVDRNIGRIIDAVQQAGQLENTIFVVTSDHGDFLGDHNLRGKSSLPYEGDMLIPLVFAGPDIPEGNSSAELCEIVDVMPTLMELLGLEQTKGNQGISLVPAMNGGTTKDAVFMEGFANQTLRTKEALYSCWRNGQEMLFDLRNDPDQFRNIAQVAQSKALLDEMRMRLLRTNMALIDPLPERVAAY